MAERLEILSPTDFLRFRDLVHDASGMDLPEIRLADLVKVLQAAKTEGKFVSNDELYRFWSDRLRGRDSLKRAIHGLTVGETYFFRDAAQFDAIRTSVIPELIERRSASRTLRIWSAGCSTGEEPYSLAILLESFAPQLSGWDVTILATDVNPTSLETAKKAIYGAWSFRQTPDGVQDRYFTPLGTRFALNPSIRAKVTFAELNFGLEFPGSLPLHEIDLILCRNVLIYLSRGAIERLALRFHQSLAPRGWLIVAPSELSQASFGMFETVNFPAAVLYRKQEPVVPRVHLTLPTQPDPLPPIDYVLAPQRPVERKAPPLASLEDVRDILKRPADESTRRIEESAVSGIIPVYYWAARVLADRTDWVQAQRWIEKDLIREPLSARSHFLHGLILGERGMLDAAASALRRCVYADRNFVLGHVALADLLDRSGELRRAGAARQTAIDLLATRADHELVAEGDGLTVGRLRALLRGRSIS